jgi:L-seryl-tRNA(Ser) seleniumtransferase
MAQTPSPSDERRRLPSVDRLLAEPALVAVAEAQGRAIVLDAARETLSEARARIASGENAPDVPTLVAQVAARVEEEAAGTLLPVINATGIIVHTNLGRAPLSAAARAAMDAVARGYSNLEYDLETGGRGSRYVHAEALLRRLTGAEAGLVVNNNAGAILLALSALARDREVVISRAQLVEIGGGFRIPDVLRQSGARLVEVGTTNRTHGRDFEAAIDADTALLLRVHSSNFKQVGFTAEVSLADMAAIAHTRGIWLLDDLGSGTLLDTTTYGLAREPMAQESVAAGADLVTFSGDKLLGGPQAGLIVGRADLVERLRRHPLTRALRVDKATLAGLQATLLHYVRGEALREIPVWRMISMSLDELARRASAMALTLADRGITARVAPTESAVGGGSLPGETLGSLGLAISARSAAAASARLRAGKPPVVARIVEGELLLDLRTVQPEEDEILLDALTAALRSE